MFHTEMKAVASVLLELRVTRDIDVKSVKIHCDKSSEMREHRCLGGGMSRKVALAPGLAG